MELLNIPSLITIGDGNGGQATASLREYLRSLIQANSIATYATHKADIYGAADTGAIRVRIPQYLQSKTYNPLGGNANSQLQVSEVIVPIDQMRMVKALVDQFDLVRFQNSGAYQAEVLGKIATTIVADLNANFYLTCLECLKKNKQNVIVIDNFDADISDDFTKAKVNAYAFSRFINKQKAVFDKIHYSLETSDIISVINANGQLNLIAGLTTGSAGDKAIDVQVKGSNVVGNSLYGNTYVVDNMVIGNILPSGSSFSEDEEFDFSNLSALSIYAGAVACASYIQSLTTAIDPDTLNPIVGCKYLYGIKVVLEQFVWAVVKDNSSFTANLNGAKLNLLGNNISTASSLTLKVVSTPQSLDLSDYGTITATSDDTSIATVAYADGVVTVTKKAAGTATITVSPTATGAVGSSKVITFN